MPNQIKHMTKRTKILIGILAVAVILAGGWWIWNSQGDKITGTIIGKEINVIGEVKPIHGFVPQAIFTDCFGVGEPYELKDNGKCYYWFDYYNWSPYYVGDIMNKKVKTRAIVNKTKECPNTSQLPCDRLYFNPIKIEILNDVTITTDKTEYEQGETLNITVRNGLDKSIWYIKVTCLPSCCSLHRWENNKWENLGDPTPCIQLPLPPGTTLESDELKPGESISKQWDTMYGEFAKSERYRFSFHYGLSEDTYTEKTVYSPEFTIKEKSADEIGD